MNMDPNQISDLIQLAKAVLPWKWGMVALVALGILRLIRDIWLPRSLAAAVKTMGTQQEKDTLVELFRIANPPKPPARGTSVARTSRGTGDVR